MKSLLLPSVLFISLILAACTSIGVYFFVIAVSCRKKDFLRDNQDLIKAGTPDIWADGRNWLKDKSCEKIRIKAFDGTELCGHFIKAKRPTDKTVILVHGYTGKGLDMGCFAKYYHEEHGLNVLMPDCRAHNESKGNYIGFGWQDRKDIIRWIQYIIDNQGKTAQLFLHGVSMGGATVLMTSGEKLPSNVKFIVSDCAYTSAMDVLSYQLHRIYKLPKFPFMYITSLICKLTAGYFFSEASALRQVTHSNTPLLFIHGGTDTFVPTEMVYRLYDAAASEKDIFVVKDAGHAFAYWNNPDEYEQKLEQYMERYLA